MLNWYHILNICFSIAMFLIAELAIGGILAFILNQVKTKLSKRKVTNTIHDWGDQLLYDFARMGVNVYVKSAGWIASITVILLIAAGLIALASWSH